MEESVKRTFAVALLSAVPLAAGAQASAAPKWFEEFEKKFPPVAKNAAAEDLETLGRALGFDPRGAAGEEHPTKEDREAFLQAGYGSWLDAQLKTSDDSIGAPPVRFVEFLEKKQSTLWRVVGLLEKEVPEWGFCIREGEKVRNDQMGTPSGSLPAEPQVAAALGASENGLYVA